ncbi:precorrin-6A/cobalt-precorrin-6A reductase, partial [Streptomyces sp. NPDC058953]
MHVLILGGTTEARRLAGLLAAGEVPGARVTSSLAGRVAAPRLPPGEVRIGGFGGADGLADWLRTHAVDLLVDATHPFA